MDYNNCDTYEKKHLKTIQRQQAIIKHYSKEAHFYSRLSTISILLLILAVVVIYNIVK